MSSTARELCARYSGAAFVHGEQSLLALHGAVPYRGAEYRSFLAGLAQASLRLLHNLEYEEKREATRVRVPLA